MAAPIVDVHVQRVGDDLEVTWRGGRDVSVSVSRIADEAGAELCPADEHGRVTLRGLDPLHRHYVHLHSAGDDGETVVVVAAERRVPLGSTFNFRDLGGYAGADGRRVRWGRIFRSDHLCNLDEADLERLSALGVRLVVDYRRPEEHVSLPSGIVPGGPIERRDLPVDDGSVSGRSLFDQLRDGTLVEFTAEDIAAYYLVTLELSAPIFGEVLALAADPANHALVFHCHAGKDRTGLTAALLLSVLGVDDAQILDDYELTNNFRATRRVAELRKELTDQGIHVDLDRYPGLFTAPRPAMARALAGLRERYGSVESYLVQQAGLSTAILSALRANLLTD